QRTRYGRRVQCPGSRISGAGSGTGEIVRQVLKAFGILKSIDVVKRHPAPLRMLPNPCKLGCRKRSGFQQNVIGHADLTGLCFPSLQRRGISPAPQFVPTFTASGAEAVRLNCSELNDATALAPVRVSWIVRVDVDRRCIDGLLD